MVHDAFQEVGFWVWHVDCCEPLIIDRARILAEPEMTTTDAIDADPLANPGAADAFWRSVEGAEPMSAIRAISEALAQSTCGRSPHVDRLRALFALDRRAQLLLESQLLRLATAPLDSPELERQLRHAVFELSRVFAHSYMHFLQHIRGKRLRSAWIDGVPAILVRLFYHRQIELLLHLFRYEAWPRGRWREVHDAYRFAQGLSLAQASIDRGEEPKSAITPENMYLRILLAQLLDTGQFRAPELAVARKWVARWSHLVALRPVAAAETAGGFVVDIAGADGPARASAGNQGDCLWLDTTPIATAIDREIELLRDTASGSRERRLTLLSRLRMVFAPVPTRIARRGERKAVALVSVQATIGGLASIFSMLREELRRRTEMMSVPDVEEISITEVRAFAPRPTPGGTVEDGFSAFPPTASFGVPQVSWQVRDRSVSGSRLRGRVSNPRRTIPGSLIAFREDERAQWMLAVVRRLKRLPGSNVEIGVEHLGCSPQPMVLSALQPDMPESRPFPALYLHESMMDVNSRVRTLVVPASRFEPGRVYAMSSANVEVTIRLMGPLEYQDDFVWTAFEVVAATNSCAMSSVDARKTSAPGTPTESRALQAS